MDTATVAPDLDAIAASYQGSGFAIVDTPVVEADLLERVAVAIPKVIAGEYPTGREPSHRHWNPGDDENTFVKIDQIHWCDESMLALASHAGVGEVAAAATGADMVQMWASQMIIKPSAPGTGTALGWHQDDLYWQNHWDGEVFTIWIAIADVPANAGPVNYVAGSHTWPVAQDGDFRIHDLDDLKGRLTLPEDATWEEHAAVLPAGGIGMHHKRTMHASSENTSGKPRMGFILHCRTEKSAPKNNAGQMFSFDLDDHENFPILFQR